MTTPQAPAPGGSGYARTSAVKPERVRDDGWQRYCAAFHELFGDKTVELSPVAIEQAIQSAVAEERASICDELEHGFSDDEGHHKQYADAIRGGRGGEGG